MAWTLTATIDDPVVVGACAEGVYIAGRDVLVLYARDGRELNRWTVRADRVVGDIALAIEHDPCATRLSDGAVLYRFSHIERHDDELLWGHTEKRWGDEFKAMSSQVRKITGEVVLDLANVWVDELWWDREHIYVRGDVSQTFDRTGARVRDGAPEPPTMGRDLSLWAFAVGGGWEVYCRGRRLLVGQDAFVLPDEPDAIGVAPPWIALHRDGAITFVALDELPRVDPAAWFQPPDAFIAWYEKLAAAGITPENRDRDAHLLRVFDGETAPTDTSLALALPGFSPCCVEHDGRYFDPEDPFYELLSDTLDDITVEEVGRNAFGTALIRIRSDGVSFNFQCQPIAHEIVSYVDGMLERFGSERRVYALAQYQEDMYAYLVITPAQRDQLVAAGVRGIHPSHEMPNR